MARKADGRIDLDPRGFNELRMCRTGPIVYNKFDVYIGGSFRKYGEFSLGEQLLFEALIGTGQVVVEVGANIGGHTVELARLVGPDGEVHAFEPQRIVFQALCANLALNQCTNVFAHQAAVGAESGSVLVPAHNPSVTSNFAAVSLRTAVSHGERVPLVTLDSLDLPACHLIKADVEGMEVEVLLGARGTIETYRPILYLENDRKERSEELLTIIFAADYKAYWHFPKLFNPDNFDGDDEDIFPGIVSCNVLCVPKEAGQNIQGLRPVASVHDWLL